MFLLFFKHPNFRTESWPKQVIKMNKEVEINFSPAHFSGLLISLYTGFAHIGGFVFTCFFEPELYFLL